MILVSKTSIIEPPLLAPKEASSQKKLPLLPLFCKQNEVTSPCRLIESYSDIESTADKL